MRYQIRPLGAWTDPTTENRRSTGVFRATWDDTLKLLARETHLLGAEIVVIQVDADPSDIRRDGMLRARAHVGFPGVAVSFESDRGPLRFATDAYEQKWSGDLAGWQGNVRAVALGLEALRAVDRYGVTSRGEQYVGWAALPAGPSNGFPSADAALAWMRRTGVELGLLVEDVVPQVVYRRLARRLHPDAPTGDRELWARLDEARQLLKIGGVL